MYFAFHHLVVLPASPVVDTGIGTTAMIVISVCAVLIVAIIAGTIFVIICRRHGGQEGTYIYTFSLTKSMCPWEKTLRSQ